jgi:hypothetical protein
MKSISEKESIPMLEFTLVDEPTANAVVAQPEALEVSAVPTEAPVAEVKPEAPAVDPLAALAARVEALTARLEAPSSSAQPEVVAEPEVDPVDFYLDPTAAVKEMVRRTLVEDAKAAEVRTVAASQAQATLLEKHADANAVVASEDFKKFVSEDPVAAQLIAQARTNLDGAAAAAALSLFKTRPAAKATPDAAASTATSANAEASLAASAASNADSTTARITISRDQIAAMSADEKERRNDEILQAYAEGRVTR